MMNLLPHLTFGLSKKRIPELAQNLIAISQSKGAIKILKSRWGMPLTILPVCALLKKFEINADFETDQNSVEFVSYLKTIQFPTGTDIVRYSPNKSYLPLTRMDLPVAQNQLNNIAGEYVKLILSYAGSSQRDDLRTGLDYIFGEMTTNVFEHSHASNYWLFAQKWPNSNAIEFCIVDDGIGIRKRFLEEGVTFSDDIEAITAAVQGQSAKTKGSKHPSERGYGIGSTVKILTGSDFEGTFLLISGKAGYIKRFAKEPEIFEFPFEWPGVIVSARLKFPKDSFDLYKYLG